MTRWFFDTEFHEDGRIIDLISIALVSDEGRGYLAVSSEFDESACSDWVKENVLPKLPKELTRKTRAEIAQDIRELVLGDGSKPEFWAYFAATDWVAFYQLYGRMIDLPKGFPFYCHDLKQLMHERGIEKSQLPKQETESEHSVLADAHWVREAHQVILATEHRPEPKS